MFNFTFAWSKATSRFAVLVSDEVTYEVYISARYPIVGTTGTAIDVGVITTSNNIWQLESITRIYANGKTYTKVKANPNV